MSGTSTQEHTTSTGPDPVVWLVGAVTIAAMVQGSAGGPSFLDSGELIAAARELGGIHPPGHPAWLSLAGLAELLPLGAYGARVVWLSALFGGIAAGLLTRIARRVLGAFGQTPAGALWSAATGLALASSLSLWLVGTRAEVYTLALATNLWALDAGLRAGDASKRGDRWLPATVEVAIAIALGLLNHHYVTLFAIPAVLVGGLPALRALFKQPRALAQVVGVAAFAGLAYLAQPLRALADTEMRWGNPATPKGFWDTVTAAHFQRSVTAAHVDLGHNTMVLLGTVADGMGIWLAGAGLIGLGLATIRRSRVAIATWVALVSGLMTKALMTIDTRNPDDHGYVLFAAAALALGLALGARVVFGEDGLLPNLTKKRRAWLATIVVPWLLLFAVLGFVLRTTEPSTWLAPQRGSDTVDDELRRALPPGAVYLSNYFGMQFNEAAWRIAEGRRPDIVTSHISFRTGDTDGGGSFKRWFAQRYPKEKTLAIAAHRLGRAPIGNVLEMAEEGRVYVEHDPKTQIPSTVLGFDGLAHRIKPRSERTLEYNLAVERTRHKRTWDRLYGRLGKPTLLDHQTRSVLAWQHALQVAHALRRGWRTIARDELVRARALAPRDGMLDRLEGRLQLLDGAWRDGDIKRFHQLWRGNAELDLSALAAPTAAPRKP